MFLENFLFWALVLRVVISKDLTQQHEKKQNRKFVSVVCHRDRTAYLMTLLSLKKTFPVNTNASFYVIDDGSLTEFDRWLFKKNGVSRVIKSQKKAFQEIKYLDLKKYFPNQTVVLLDSDVLFFRFPKQLFDPDPTFMKDYISRYGLSDPEVKVFFGHDPVQLVNVGLGVIDTAKIDEKLYKNVELFLDKIEKSRNVERYYTDQTAYAILMSRQTQFKFLEKEYFLLAQNKFAHKKFPSNLVCIHYTTWFRKERILDSAKMLLITRCFTRK